MRIEPPDVVYITCAKYRLLNLATILLEAKTPTITWRGCPDKAREEAEAHRMNCICVALERLAEILK